MKIVISSGHGKYVRGASGLIDEVDEARKVVKETAILMRERGAEVIEFHDDVSKTQSDNLHRIVDFHNSKKRDLDISVHFNAYMPTDGARGTEVLYLTQKDLAAKVCNAIVSAGGFINRGAHKRTDLYFLNNTSMPAILLEICFVDAKIDVENYHKNFHAICQAIADSIVEKKTEIAIPVGNWSGKVSWFGGPQDDGVAPDEGLAFLYEVEDAPYLFLDEQPKGTTGLARRLDPDEDYIAMRWDYNVYPKSMLRSSENVALVKAKKTGKQVIAHPADWGPHGDTKRIADISPGLMDRLGIKTDDEVEVIFPYLET